MRLLKQSLALLVLALSTGACIFQTANSFSGDVKIDATGPYAAVAPLWSKHGCTACHSSLATLSTDAEWLASTEWGARIVPGDAAASDLYNSCNGGANGTAAMPPSGSNGTALSAEELQLVADWINSVSASSN
jgi:cytochrome c5